MSSIKPLYQDPRWNQLLGGKVIGCVPLTPEEEKETHEKPIALLQNMGYTCVFDPYLKMNRISLLS